MKFSKQQWSWIFYDWANSGYGILVTTAVLPVYFKAIAESAGVSAANSTAYWGYANSIGTLIVSLLAPLLGTLVEHLFRHRDYLDLLLSLGSQSAMAAPFTGLHLSQHRLFRREPLLR